MALNGKLVTRIVMLLAVCVVFGFFVYLPFYVESSKNTVIEHGPYDVSPEGRKLHKTLIVGDWHADPLLWNRDLTKRGDYGQTDIVRLLEGNVALQVFTAVTKSPAGLNYQQNSADARDNITPLVIAQRWPLRTWGSLRERALYQAEKLHRFEERSQGQLRIVKTKNDLEYILSARAKGEQILGGILGIEGSHPLEGDLSNIQVLYDAGHRVFGLQHFFDNELGGSLHGQTNHGLTEFGRQVVSELAERPVVIDLAHSSIAVVQDVLDITDIPLIVSHTGLHSHCPVKRNIPDALLKDVVASGGVVGMGYWLDVNCEGFTPLDVAKMIKAAVDVLGEDHVSLGSDYDGSIEAAFDTSELSALTTALLHEGLTVAQIRKVMGENMVRVLRARLE